MLRGYTWCCSGGPYGIKLSQLHTRQVLHAVHYYSGSRAHSSMTVVLILSGFSFQTSPHSLLYPPMLFYLIVGRFFCFSNFHFCPLPPPNPVIHCSSYSVWSTFLNKWLVQNVLYGITENKNWCCTVVERKGLSFTAGGNLTRKSATIWPNNTTPRNIP